jgi:nucleotide-binding universal stress UspA family protein
MSASLPRNSIAICTRLYIEEIAQTVRKHIEAYHTGEASPSVSVKAVILNGDPAAEIIDYAEENDVSLVVIVSHGRLGIMPWSVGSVVGRVMRGISKPPLFIRGSAIGLQVGNGGNVRQDSCSPGWF